jgi:hypothetical protein
MGVLYLKDLADKTRRGLRGRVEDGKSGGGLCYGYDVVRQIDANSGATSRGERTINEAEANIVRRIFVDYLGGKSSRTIAMQLNSEGVPGPQGSEWGPSTIHGNPKRGTGILNNELYIGKLVWNRLRYRKDPDTGKRVSRPNPESEWVIQEVPELRIIDQNLWDAVKARQAQLALEPGAKPGDNLPLNDRRRPKHLFTGLVKCGCCGGGYSMISKDMLGYTNARTKGTCDNRLNIRCDTLEATILNGLDKHLMEPELFLRGVHARGQQGTDGGAGINRRCPSGTQAHRAGAREDPRSLSQGRDAGGDAQGAQQQARSAEEKADQHSRWGRGAASPAASQPCQVLPRGNRRRS